MRFQSTFFALLSLALVPVRDASACGGYFVDVAHQGQTHVSSHRMALAISPTKTTLWDQISYTGDPQSFAWVLPIKGKVVVGTSSDAFFNNLEQQTQVSVHPGPVTCPSSAGCKDESTYVYLDPYNDPPSSKVDVIAREAVGPYDTAQLSSQDPDALKTWLTDHSYTLPDDISPVISAYVAEGFNFLAIKLLPGQGIESMKPVRVTTPGANPVLPLRMVAAGAGVTVPITLWVLGDSYYLPSNFPSFSIAKDQLAWDWDRNESNYKSLLQDGFTKTSNKGWLLESGSWVFLPNLTAPLFALAMSSPEQSGYGDGMTVKALEACGADIDAMASGSDTITRLYAELSREALATDLTLESTSMSGQAFPFIHDRRLFATKSVGEAPCPVSPPCDEPLYMMNDGGGCVCTTSLGADASPAPFGGLLALGVLLAYRRKKAVPVA